jgi:hypothetical protein
MIAATPITVAIVKQQVTGAVKYSLRDYPGATFKVGVPVKSKQKAHNHPTGCWTGPAFGTCVFYVVGHFNDKSPGLQKCFGTVDVRRNPAKRGQYQRRFNVLGCVPV